MPKRSLCPVGLGMCSIHPTSGSSYKSDKLTVSESSVANLEVRCFLPNNATSYQPICDPVNNLVRADTRRAIVFEGDTAVAQECVDFLAAAEPYWNAEQLAKTLA